MLRKILFCPHAEDKLVLLKAHGFFVDKSDVIEALKRPDKEEIGYGGRYIAQKGFDNEHVIRVIYEKHKAHDLIVTIYPGRRSYYES